VAPPDVLRARVRERRHDASEADVAVIELLQSRQDPLSAAEQANTITLDTTGAMDTATLAQQWLARA
jgi:predicted kinase